MLRQDDLQKSQLVLTGWRWGNKYGGHQASCIVMDCIMNRVRAGWSGGNLFDVLEKIPAYAAVKEMPTGNPNIWEPSFLKLLHEVDSIYAGTATPWAQGGLYWCDSSQIETAFFKDKILPFPDVHPRVCDMNTLWCFK